MQVAPRIITADGKLFVVGSDSDFEYQQTILTTAPITNLAFQLGTVAGATDTLNATTVTLQNPAMDRIKYDRVGAVTITDFTMSARDGTAGSEFVITYN